MNKINIKKINNVTVLDFSVYEKFDNLIAVHSTRLGGISKGVFSEMNLGFSRGDDRDDVLNNYKLFASAIDVSYEKMVLSDQWHHTTILNVKKEHQGMGIVKERNFSDVDGLITNVKDIPLVTFYADCVPIYFYDPIKNVIGMAHSGWRGTVAGISKVMIEKFCIDYDSDAGNIIVAIGPSICKSCYEVGKEVVEGLKELPFDISEFYEYKESKKSYYIDLFEINKKMLLELGIKDENISVSYLCTKCNNELLFSHRAHGNDRGTQIGVMMLK